MTAHKRHKAAKSTLIGYRYPVGPHYQQDPRSHGAICWIEYCSCGAKKETNSNGRFSETTGWVRCENGD